MRLRLHVVADPVGWLCVGLVLAVWLYNTLLVPSLVLLPHYREGHVPGAAVAGECCRGRLLRGSGALPGGADPGLHRRPGTPPPGPPHTPVRAPRLGAVQQVQPDAAQEVPPLQPLRPLRPPHGPPLPLDQQLRGRGQPLALPAALRLHAAAQLPDAAAGLRPVLLPPAAQRPPPGRLRQPPRAGAAARVGAVGAADVRRHVRPLLHADGGNPVGHHHHRENGPVLQPDVRLQEVLAVGPGRGLRNTLEAPVAPPPPPPAAAAGRPLQPRPRVAVSTPAPPPCAGGG